MGKSIYFFEENIKSNLKSPEKTKRWLNKICQNENVDLQSLNYIFCKDDYLHKINLEHLNHDNLTDIITFDNSNKQDIIEGDVFISIERIFDNSIVFETDYQTELLRVMAHGLLHLIGFNDKTKTQKNLMNKKENEYLLLYTNQF